MTPHRVTTVLVALSCIAAVGVAATTLETTFETDPDDAVDLDYEVVPINPDDAGSLDRAMSAAKSDEGEGASAAVSGAKPGAPAPGDGAERRRRVDGGSDADGHRQARRAGEDRPDRAAESGDGRPSDGDAASGDDRSDAAAGSSDSSSSSSSSSDDGTTQTPGQNWLDRLLSLLASWLPALVVLAVVVASAAVLVRYRERIVRRLRAPPADRGASTPRPLDPDPENAVERAWVAVLAAADVDDPRRRTPGECAAAAVASGLDPEGVERLRRVFEEVRYGGREVTPERRRRAERGLDRLDLGRVER